MAKKDLPSWVKKEEKNAKGHPTGSVILNNGARVRRFDMAFVYPGPAPEPRKK